MSTKKEDKAAILARRAAFIAAAVAALTQNECKKTDPGPSPCLEPMPYDGDAGDESPAPIPVPCLTPMMAPQDAEAEPAPCLSIPMQQPDAGPEPRPCLSPPPQPRPCLTPKRPEPRPCLSKAK